MAEQAEQVGAELRAKIDALEKALEKSASQMTLETKTGMQQKLIALETGM